MKTKILCLGVIILATVFVLNVAIVKKGYNEKLSLKSLVSLALADDEGQNCPGGSCTFTEYRGGEIEWTCSACCPEGKNPGCNTFGCKCD